MSVKVFGPGLHPQLTIGHDAETARGLEALGARHVACDVDSIIVDQANRILSTPAYMEARTIKEVFTGIDKLVAELLVMAR